MHQTDRPGRAGRRACSCSGSLRVAASAAEPNFPAKDSRYHNYPEMVDEIMAAQAAYPDLVAGLVDRQELQGSRHLDRQGVRQRRPIDEAEPEVLIDALHHAREHLTTEQALYLLKVLTQDYATDSEVKRLVDSREIWIVFALNPDGMQYDLTGNPYREWRKNRQPNAGSIEASGPTSTGTTTTPGAAAGGSSGSPGSLTYRGRKPFSAPETQAMRDFVRSRVVDGRQQIRLHLTLHTNGQLVLWPYGHTKKNIPADMTTRGPRRLRRARQADGPAQRLQGRAVERPVHHRRRPDRLDVRPLSDLLVHLGALPDRALHGLRLLSGRREDRRRRSPGTGRRCSTRSTWPTARTAPIVQAQTMCGPLIDDFEINRGWVRNPDGTDTATDGSWQIGEPGGGLERGSEAARHDDVRPVRRS